MPPVARAHSSITRGSGALIPLLLACATAAAQEPRPTVLDLYRLAPASALFPEGLDPDRDAVVAVRDVANGYLRLEGAWEGFTEVALFRTADGASLLVVARAECGPLCEQTVRAFAARAGGLVEVTEEVLPPVAPDRLAAAWDRLRQPGDPDLEGEDLAVLLLLPRFGTTIRVVVPPEVAGREVTLLELRWNRSAFELH
jgi:hypothetical protein